MLLLSFKDICVVLCLFVCQFPALFSLVPTGDFFCFVLTGKNFMDKKYVPEKKKRCRSANRVGRFCRY